jgi:hypothetical protein
MSILIDGMIFPRLSTPVHQKHGISQEVIMELTAEQVDGIRKIAMAKAGHMQEKYRQMFLDEYQWIFLRGEMHTRYSSMQTGRLLPKVRMLREIWDIIHPDYPLIDYNDAPKGGMLGDGIRVNANLLSSGGYDSQALLDQVEGVWEKIEGVPEEDIPGILASPSRLKKFLGSLGRTMELTRHKLSNGYEYEDRSWGQQRLIDRLKERLTAM